MKRRASLLLAAELAAFAVLLCFAVWIRVQSVPQLGGDRLFGTDAYRFFRQAEIILQDGSLPEADMERWLPTGRDLTVYLIFSSYFLARLTQFLQLFFPNITLYHVAVYYPVGAFAAFMVVCYAFARRYLGRAAALIGALLLAVAPSAVGRIGGGVNAPRMPRQRVEKLARFKRPNPYGGVAAGGQDRLPVRREPGGVDASSMPSLDRSVSVHTASLSVV